MVCLQELWDEDQREEVISDLKEKYPYSYHAPKFDDGCDVLGCSDEDYDILVDCFDIFNCIDALFDDLIDCLEDQCDNLVT